MSHDVRAIADAVLHEGYLLYPYAASALKNLHRYPFGTLYPEAFCAKEDAGDASAASVECIAVGPPEATLAVDARFLQLVGPGGAVRDVSVPPARPVDLAAEPVIVRFEHPPLRGEIAVAASKADAPDGWKVAASLRNATCLDDARPTTRDGALAYALASAHLLLRIAGGALTSAIDPPDDLRDVVAGCRSSGLWPVLVGPPGSRDTMLAAPIILYDHPELAPESAGDFFDGTEIDELLTLRILTLTDEEKRAMAEADSRARELLERTEAAGISRLAELHGRMRSRAPLGPGARVRLRPNRRADIFDLALAGKLATVQAIERDLEGRAHVVVTVDDDPGKDLGAYGHRFFFRLEEVELL